MNIKVRYKNKTTWVLNVSIPESEPVNECDFDFDMFEYEINGITFTKWSKKLEATIEQAFFWDNLND